MRDGSTKMGSLRGRYWLPSGCMRGCTGLQTIIPVHREGEERPRSTASLHVDGLVTNKLTEKRQLPADSRCGGPKVPKTSFGHPGGSISYPRYS